ncbi:MAG: alpha/beta hydrolase [Candidatus Competibacteraceae bacterium]|nr:alpha/beta hydrolase [Candidatus Competibacteraceae bacterium]
MNKEIKKDGEFEYLDAGQGPVMIVLHGLFGALSNFRDVVDHFSSSYRVVIPIMPIYTMPIINTNIKNLARHIEAFIDHMGFEDVIMLGNSLGGHVGLIYATMCPDKLRALVLTGSSGLYENAFGSSYPRKNDYEYIRNRVEYTFYDPQTASKELVDEVFGLLSDKSKAIRSISLAKSAIRHNMAHELPNMHVPVCLIWGRNDNITPPEVAEEFHKNLPDSDLFWIDECGHAPMMERPEEFNRLLSRWLSSRNFI